MPGSLLAGLVAHPLSSFAAVAGDGSSRGSLLTALAVIAVAAAASAAAASVTVATMSTSKGHHSGMADDDEVRGRAYHDQEEAADDDDDTFDDDRAPSIAGSEEWMAAFGADIGPMVSVAELKASGNLGVVELMLLTALDRACAAKAAWSLRVRVSQAAVVSLGLDTEPEEGDDDTSNANAHGDDNASIASRRSSLVVLEEPHSPPATATVVLRPDVFVALREAERATEAAVAVAVRMLVKYNYLHDLEALLNLAPLDPMPWTTVPLSAVRTALLALFADQSEPRTVTFNASDKTTVPSMASPKRRASRPGSRMVGSSMPAPRAAPTHKPGSLVNYNNSASARGKHSSPLNAASTSPTDHQRQQIGHPTSPLSPLSPLSANATPTAATAHGHRRTSSRGMSRRPVPARLHLATATSGNGGGGDLASPLYFDVNRYWRTAGPASSLPSARPSALPGASAAATAAVDFADSPITTPVPSPGLPPAAIAAMVAGASPLSSAVVDSGNAAADPSDLSSPLSTVASKAASRLYQFHHQQLHSPSTTPTSSPPPLASSSSSSSTVRFVQ
ncbi:hypothetical protein BC828DRAFT_403572 [Blastocladiella britannica]|nr:hypothetical protein BC828DRAFT_403572 [Blastocladiella britannica]